MRMIFILIIMHFRLFSVDVIRQSTFSQPSANLTMPESGTSSARAVSALICLLICLLYITL